MSLQALQAAMTDVAIERCADWHYRDPCTSCGETVESDDPIYIERDGGEIVGLYCVDCSGNDADRADKSLFQTIPADPETVEQLTEAGYDHEHGDLAASKPTTLMPDDYQPMVVCGLGY